jgi:WD40 repeat protein
MAMGRDAANRLLVITTIGGTPTVWSLQHGRLTSEHHLTEVGATLSCSLSPALWEQTLILFPTMQPPGLRLYELGDSSVSLVSEGSLGDDLMIISAVALAPDSTGRTIALSGHANGSIQLWQDEGSRLVPLGDRVLGHTNIVSAIAIGTDVAGRAIVVTGDDSGGESGQIRLWWLTGGRLAAHPPVPNVVESGTKATRRFGHAVDVGSRVLSLSVSVNGDVLAWCQRGVLRLSWRALSGS